MSGEPKLFERHGFEETTMRMLAAEAGLGLGTLFVHFKDKRALLAATLFDGLEVAISHAVASKPRRASARKQLIHLTEPLLRHYARNPLLSQVLLKESLFLRGDWGAQFDAQLTDFQDAVAGVYNDARERGAVRANVDTRLAATAFLAFYLLTLVAGLRGATSVEQQLKMLAALVDQQLQGFQPPTAKGKARS